MTTPFTFTLDKKQNKIYIERSFAAPLAFVWAAWTEAKHLDQWWGPKPWRAETLTMDFRPGGRWVYVMVGPEGERHVSFCDYKEAEELVRFVGVDGFCDEKGTINTDMPQTTWEVSFETVTETMTQVRMVLQFQTEKDLETIISMGFQEGFTAGMENLDAYIAEQKTKSAQVKTPRVSIYLNFPGTTEEAFLFYKSVFKTEFVGGIHRFGDMPVNAEQPPLSEEMKQKVVHVELPILGGLIVMGTDVTAEMGFTVTPGNNMYINLEPDSREEVERLFHGLSEGGVIEMPLQDTFWGAYYGSFADKYGVRWMVNYQNS